MTPWAIHPVEFVLLLVAAFLSGVAVMCLVAANDLKRDESKRPDVGEEPRRARGRQPR